MDQSVEREAMKMELATHKITFLSLTTGLGDIPPKVTNCFCSTHFATIYNLFWICDIEHVDLKCYSKRRLLPQLTYLGARSQHQHLIMKCHYSESTMLEAIFITFFSANFKSWGNPKPANPIENARRSQETVTIFFTFNVRRYSQNFLIEFIMLATFDV